MADTSTSGEFSIVRYYDAQHNEQMFVRFWVNGHEALMPLSELVSGLKDGKEIEAVIPEDTSVDNKLVNMNEVLETIGRLQEETTIAVANRKAAEATKKANLNVSVTNKCVITENSGSELENTEREEISVSENFNAKEANNV